MPVSRAVLIPQTSFVSAKGSSVIRKVLQAYLQPALLLLCIGGGFRLGAGLVWAYNVKPFFAQLYCGGVNVGIYLSWVPIVGGTLGTLFGGLVSDRLARASGYKGRMWVLILSQVSMKYILKCLDNETLLHLCGRDPV